MDSVDWSPNDEMIAFNIRNNKTVVFNVTSKIILFQNSIINFV